MSFAHHGRAPHPYADDIAVAEEAERKRRAAAFPLLRPVIGGLFGAGLLFSLGLLMTSERSGLADENSPASEADSPPASGQRTAAARTSPGRLPPPDRTARPSRTAAAPPAPPDGAPSGPGKASSTARDKGAAPSAGQTGKAITRDPARSGQAVPAADSRERPEDAEDPERGAFDTNAPSRRTAPETRDRQVRQESASGGSEPVEASPASQRPPAAAAGKDEPKDRLQRTGVTTAQEPNGETALEPATAASSHNLTPGKPPATSARDASGETVLPRSGEQEARTLAQPRAPASPVAGNRMPIPARDDPQPGTASADGATTAQEPNGETAPEPATAASSHNLTPGKPPAKSARDASGETVLPRSGEQEARTLAQPRSPASPVAERRIAIPAPDDPRHGTAGADGRSGADESSPGGAPTRLAARELVRIPVAPSPEPMPAPVAPPSPPPAPPAPPPPPPPSIQFDPDGPYLVQVAALANHDTKCAAWERMQQRWPDLFLNAEESTVRAELPDGRVVYRLRVGAFATRREASRFCQQMKASGGSCFVTLR